MKRMRVILLMVMMLAAAGARAQGSVKEWKGQIEDHPRLLLKEGEEVRIKEMIAGDEDMARIHRGIISECEKMLVLPVLERVMEGKRLLHTSREALKRIFWLAYSYRMSGNEAYADRAVDEMMAVCTFIDWNPSHFLDVGEMVMAVAIGYDWLYDHMTPSQRRTVKEAIVEKGFIPADDERYAGFYNLANNWNQVCCGGLLYGALATYEEHPETARGLTDLYVKSVPFALSCYAPDGGYPEGFNYWGYGTSFQVMMIAALESAMGTDFGLSEAPGFLDTAAFVQFMTAPTGECFNFSDAVPYAPSNPMMFWFASRTGEIQRIWLERRNIENLPDHFMDDVSHRITEHRLLPSLMIFASAMDMSRLTPPEEHFRVYEGRTPLFIYRSGWERREDAYLGIKGGSPTTSHAHMDAGSFVYEYDGVRWSADLGMQDYHSLESLGVDLWNQGEGGQRWDVFRLGNESHSTLTINGKHHKVKSFVPIVETWRERDRKGARLDMTSAFAEDVDSLTREIWLDRKDRLHVRDVIRTGKEQADVMWVMTTTAQAEILPDGSILLEKDGKKMKLENNVEGLAPHIWTNDPPHDYDASNPGTCRVGFTIDIPAASETVIEVSLTPVR
ncbi:MAG: heparinase II/III family protein [Bacteroidales bacterium]|nr:heparinase II/III family protein [Bacteroidales bacterium]